MANYHDVDKVNAVSMLFIFRDKFGSFYSVVRISHNENGLLKKYIRFHWEIFTVRL